MSATKIKNMEEFSSVSGISRPTVSKYFHDPESVRLKTREDGSLIAANDPFWDDLHATAIAAKEDPRIWLAQRQYYGDLAGNAGFSQSFGNWLTLIWSDGLEAAITDYLAS